PVADYDSAAKSDAAGYAGYFTAMLKAGIYLAPSQFEACFVSTRHAQKHIAETIAAVRRLSSQWFMCQNGMVARRGVSTLISQP
ncbi:MAG: hypothetical protein ACYS21_16125, partial [Planctomycetota bacterium]